MRNLLLMSAAATALALGSAQAADLKFAPGEGNFNWESYEALKSTQLNGDGIRKGEECVITVELPPLWLNPGVYTVHFKVLVQGISGSKARYLSDQVPFTVTGAANPVSSTVLNPPATWSVRSRS